MMAEAKKRGTYLRPTSKSLYFSFVTTYPSSFLCYSTPFIWDHYHRCDLDEEMASKALETSLRQTKRLLWEKYNKPGRNLYEALIAFEHNGVGQKVASMRWIEKGFKNCYYTVTSMKPRFTLHGLHGHARGVLTWNGKVTLKGQSRRISNGLKDKWRVLP